MKPEGWCWKIPFGESDFIFYVVVSITFYGVIRYFEFWFHGDGEGGEMGGIGQVGCEGAEELDDFLRFVNFEVTFGVFLTEGEG